MRNFYGVDKVEVPADVELAKSVSRGMLMALCELNGPMLEKKGYSQRTIVASHALAHLMSYASITMVTDNEKRAHEFLDAIIAAVTEVGQKFGQADNN